MSKVTVQEVIDELHFLARHAGYHESEVADRIKQHGIEVAYTPMTDDELCEVPVGDETMNRACADCGGIPVSALRAVQQAFIQRANLTVKG